jgi:hypothetical protein
MNKQQFKDLVLECKDQNLTGKRKRDTRLEVVEDAITILGIEGDASILLPLILEELEKKPKEKKAKKANKPSASTTQGYTESQDQLLPVKTGFDVAIITTAQNNTITTGFQDRLLDLKADMIKKGLKAELIVMPSYYNKNAFDPNATSEREYFDPSIREYVIDSDCWLWERNAVRLAVTAGVLPTAKLPVNSAAQLNTGELVTVVASPKQQYKTLPRLNDQSIRKAVTTGAVTGYNYKNGRAGSEAEKEHKQGAMIAYKCDSGYNVVNLMQGSDGTIELLIPELEYLYNNAPKAAKLGDLHCEVADDQYWAKQLSLLEKLDLDFIAVDDILHFSTRSHHNRGSGKHLYATKAESVENDLAKVIEQLTELSEITGKVFVTESNHNSALDHWLDDGSVNIKADSHNSKIYYLLNWLVCDTMDQGEHTKNALQIALENADLTKLPDLPYNVEFGRMERPERPIRWDYSQHGHKGQNGSAGNANLFRSWNLELIVGHTHSPTIMGSVFTTGVTARLDQGYNRGGASSWDHGSMYEYENGSVQLITLNAQKVLQ